MIKIGITGHQYLHNKPILKKAITESIIRIKQQYAGRKCELYSALAAGADTLAAESALENAIPLNVIFSFDQKGYLSSMSSEQQGIVKELVHKANCQINLPQTIGQNSFEEIASFLVTQMDCLIAVWNGQEARGPGGTGEVVQEFNRSGKPWVWVRADNMVPGNETLLVEEKIQGSVEFFNMGKNSLYN